MLDIKAIVDAIPEPPEESADPKAEIVQVKAAGGSVMMEPMIYHESHGAYPLRRASRILKEIKRRGGRHFYLHCW
ncbi:MAG: hypothetical protein AAB780_01605 [Patescibacteria group bacterium]